MDLNLFIIVLIAGGLLLLSFLKLSNAIAVNRKANVYFGVFAFLLSTFWLDEMIVPKSVQDNFYVFIFLRFIQFLTPVTFFLSIIFYTNPTYRYRQRDLRFAVIPALFLILLFCKPVLEEEIFFLLYIVIILSNSLFYTSWAYVKINRHQKVIEAFSSNKEPIDLNWLKYIIYSFILSAVLIILYSIATKAESLNIYINLYFLVVVYLVAFYSMRQKEIFPRGLIIEQTIEMNQPEEKAAKTKLLDDTGLDNLKTRLLELMEKEKPYLDSELNLVKLAEQLQTSSHQLSYVINNGFKENFFNFINKYRVKKAEELLKNPAYDHLTILAIGYESGFNSKTSFNTTFKKITSYTPTEYRKICSKL
jgi:AraC-like DNA-binding protein